MNYLEMHALYHHGIKGQKWGVRRAKWYPISEFKKFAQGRRDKKIAKLEAKAAKIKKKSEKYSKVETAPKKEPTAEEKEAARKKEAQDILDSHDIKKIWANKDKLTNEDIQNAIERYNIETKLSSLIPKEKSTMQKTQEFMSNTANLMNSVSSMATSFDNIASKSKNIKKTITGEKSEEELKANAEKERAKKAEKLIKTRDLDKIYANRDMLSTKELEEVNKRATQEANLFKKTSGAQQPKEEAKPASETPKPAVSAPTGLKDTLANNPEKLEQYRRFIAKNNFKISQGKLVKR